MPPRTGPCPSTNPGHTQAERHTSSAGSRAPTWATTALALASAVLLSLGACRPAAEAPPHTESTLEGVHQTGWRIRADAGASLNGDVG